MRSSTLVVAAALALVCATAAPTAAAAATSLAFDAPPSTPANSTVPVTVTLTISHFLCHEPHSIAVTLTTTNSDGVRAAFQHTTLTFQIPARSYYAEDYRESQTVNLTVRAISAGSVELGASHAADVGPCFVPGGFAPASVTHSLAVEAPVASTPPPVANETTPVNETNTTPEANATPTPATPRAPPVNRGPTCGPDGGCGLIGDYDAPAESSDKSVPGVTPLLAVGVLALAALVARRFRSK